MIVTNEDLQDIGREIQRIVEMKLQRAFEGTGDLRVVSAAAIMALIDYKEGRNLESRYSFISFNISSVNARNLEELGFILGESDK